MANESLFEKNHCDIEIHHILKDLYNDRIQFVVINHKTCIELGGNNHD
ncbi:hypothetical protein KLEB273_gp245 [Bacillus phage vB_BauM_KLEB27-3]|nr:hypothetical protein KLEB273_gp245 [Bacillus phage vB_BauM_KLEB27-3]